MATYTQELTSAVRKMNRMMRTGRIEAMTAPEQNDACQYAGLGRLVNNKYWFASDGKGCMIPYTTFTGDYMTEAQDLGFSYEARIEWHDELTENRTATKPIDLALCTYNTWDGIMDYMTYPRRDIVKRDDVQMTFDEALYMTDGKVYDRDAEGFTVALDFMSIINVLYLQMGYEAWQNSMLNGSYTDVMSHRYYLKR